MTVLVAAQVLPAPHRCRGTGASPGEAWPGQAGPGRAIFLSAAACLRNRRAFLRFGVSHCVLVAGPLLGVMLILALVPASAGAANAALIEGAAGVITIAAFILSSSQLFLSRLLCAPAQLVFQPAATATQHKSIEIYKSQTTINSL